MDFWWCVNGETPKIENVEVHSLDEVDGIGEGFGRTLSAFWVVGLHTECQWNSNPTLHIM